MKRQWWRWVVVGAVLVGSVFLGGWTYDTYQAAQRVEVVPQTVYTVAAQSVRLGECYWIERQIWAPDTLYQDGRIVDVGSSRVLKWQEPFFALGCLHDRF